MRGGRKNHPFDAATKLTGEPDRLQGHTSEAYRNMVGPFGGITAATLLRAAMIHPLRQGDPVSLTVNFIAPISEGVFDVIPQVVRTNRSTQHWIITLSQEGQVTANATAVFASRRESWSVTDLKYPGLPNDETGVRMAGEIFPNWIDRYNIRVLQGGAPPFIHLKNEEPFLDSKGLQWMCDHPRRALDFLSLAAICDTFLPRIFVRRNQFTAASTVSLTIFFHTNESSLLDHADGDVLGHVRTNRFHNTYFDQTAEVWTKKRELLATSAQIFYFKD